MHKVIYLLFEKFTYSFLSSKHIIKIIETDLNTQSLNNAIPAKNKVSEVTQFFHAALQLCTHKFTKALQ